VLQRCDPWIIDGSEADLAGRLGNQVGNLDIYVLSLRQCKIRNTLEGLKDELNGEEDPKGTLPKR